MRFRRRSTPPPCPNRYAVFLEGPPPPVDGPPPDPDAPIDGPDALRPLPSDGCTLRELDLGPIELQ